MKPPYLVLAASVLSISACVSTPKRRELSELPAVEMYEQLCASCHGPQGRGDGPVASLIKTGVPDLTRLAQRDGGEFPAEDVRRTIDGRYQRPAHGPRDMPVWGWEFYNSTVTNDPVERARVDATIGKLVDYLRSIQKE